MQIVTDICTAWQGQTNTQQVGLVYLLGLKFDPELENC